MRKRKLLFTLLALASGAFLDGSGAMAQSGGWDAVYNQTQTTSDDWTPITEGTTQGKILGAAQSGSSATSYYYVTKSLKFGNNRTDNDGNGNSGLKIHGTVYLYIPTGLTITCEGANADGRTGAGAGIELSEGNTLYIIGGGTVNARGGNAANGRNGDDGTNAGFDEEADKVWPGAGGQGGNGGGGAGAGIGSRGGTGGTGGAGGDGPVYSESSKHNGKAGSAGETGGTATAMGNLYVDQTYGITVNATGGSQASTGGTGGNGGSNILRDGGSNDSMAGGAGGGGGGFGGAAANIGTGGPGGGGGGGGAGGSVASAYSTVYSAGANGGHPGANGNGTFNTDTGFGDDTLMAKGTVKDHEGDDMTCEGWENNVDNRGAGGNSGDRGDAASNGTMNAGTLTYKITYQPVKTRVNGTNINPVTVTYSPSPGTSVVLPKNIEGYQWVLLVYGKDCSANSTTHKSPFTDENLLFYGGNLTDDADRTILLADVYGDIYFQEVASVCPLNNNSSNTDVINDFFYDANTQSQSYPITARLKDRTLYKDNHWNTICLPFDLTPAQFAASPLSGAEVKKLDTSVTGYYPNGGNSDAINLHTTEPTLVFYFADVNTSDETLQAGKPYLVRWANGTDLVDNTTKGKKNAVHQLDFPYVTVKEKQATSWSGNAANGGSVQFVGTFSPIALTGGDKTKFVLGVSDNVDKLYYPKQNISVNACRGYFIIPQAAANLFSSTSAPQIVMGFDDGETTSIQVVNGSGVKDQGSDTYYNLNGQRVAQPTKGLYIVNGKKVIVK